MAIAPISKADAFYANYCGGYYYGCSGPTGSVGNNDVIDYSRNHVICATIRNSSGQDVTWTCTNVSAYEALNCLSNAIYGYGIGWTYDRGVDNIGAHEDDYYGCY